MEAISIGIRKCLAIFELALAIILLIWTIHSYINYSDFVESERNICVLKYVVLSFYLLLNLAGILVTMRYDGIYFVAFQWVVITISPFMICYISVEMYLSITVDNYPFDCWYVGG